MLLMEPPRYTPPLTLGGSYALPRPEFRAGGFNPLRFGIDVMPRKPWMFVKIDTTPELTPPAPPKPAAISAPAPRGPRVRRYRFSLEALAAICPGAVRGSDAPYATLPQALTLVAELGLPADLRLRAVSVYTVYGWDALMLKVEHDLFAPVPDGELPPIFDVCR